MALRLSATENSRHIAQRLPQATDSSMRSITELAEDERSFSGSTIGIVSSTYYWGLPSVVDEFLGLAHIEARYLFFVATYGTTPGAIGHLAQKALGGTRIDAFFSVRMPDTWTPAFDLSTPEAVAAFTGTTEDDISSAISHIESRDAGCFMDRRIPAAGALFWKIAYPRARRTSHFHVEDS